MKTRLGHKPTALVSGASSGIGLEFARLLAGAGCNLVLVSNDEKGLQAAAAELGVPAERVICMDLARSEAADELFARCNESGLEIDILINNAGMYFWQEMDAEMLKKGEKMLALNAVTPMKMSVLFGSEMKKRGCGYIVNVSSMCAHIAMPGLTCYSGTKAFLKNFSKSLFHEYRPHGVRVCALCPAAVATPLYNIKGNLMRLGVKTGFIQTPRRVARKALRAVYRGKKVCNPALMCYYVPFLVNLLPNWLVRIIWGKIKAKREK